MCIRDRADIGAVAAADALVIVDRGHEVLDLDGFCRALAVSYTHLGYHYGKTDHLW